MISDQVEREIESELSRYLHPVQISRDSINKLRRRLFEQRDVVISQPRKFGLIILLAGILCVVVIILRRLLR